VTVGVAVAVGVEVRVGVAVAVSVGVDVRVAVEVGVAEGVAVAVGAPGVFVRLGVGVIVGVDVAGLLEKRCAKIPVSWPSWFRLSHAITKSPSVSTSIAARRWSSGVYVLTWNSIASVPPELVKRRANTP